MRTPDRVSTDSAVSGSCGVGAPVPPAGSSYWRFYDQVAAAQLSAWLPATPARVLDVSAGSRFVGLLTGAGHEVVHVMDGAADPPAARGAGRVLPVVADSRSLHWVQDGCVDLVLGESRSLSLCLATEVTIEHLARVLRRGGRILLVVESLTLGLARLAERGRWAELADAPSADVVMVPDGSGQITRCFLPEELRALLTHVGFDVEWVQPRSVLSPATVERALLQGGDAALRTLVKTELALAAEREGQSTGLHLVASARRP